MNLSIDIVGLAFSINKFEYWYCWFDIGFCIDEGRTCQ